MWTHKVTLAVPLWLTRDTSSEVKRQWGVDLTFFDDVFQDRKGYINAVIVFTHLVPQLTQCFSTAPVQLVVWRNVTAPFVRFCNKSDTSWAISKMQNNEDCDKAHFWYQNGSLSQQTACITSGQWLIRCCIKIYTYIIASILLKRRT